LRDLIAEAAAHHRERQRPNRKMVTVAVLLIVGAGLGAMLALQSGSPRGDQAIAATIIPPTSAATPAAATPTAPVAQTVAALKPAATVQTTAAAPAAPPATERGAAATGNVIATADPKAVTEPARTPAVASPAAAAAPHPAWLVEDDPVTFQDRAAGQRAKGPTCNPPPSWFVEDDAASFDSTHVAPLATAAAANLRRMVVSADVDVRTAPDAKSESIGILKAGAAISVGECTLWCAVSVNAKSGWVFYTFLADPAVAAPAH